MQQTIPPPFEVRQKLCIAGFSPLPILGKQLAMEMWWTTIGVNSDETIVSPEEDADELCQCLVLMKAKHDIRAFLTCVFHGTDVRGRA